MFVDLINWLSDCVETTQERKTLEYQVWCESEFTVADQWLVRLLTRLSTGQGDGGVFFKWSGTFTEFSEFRESEKSLKHELGSI